MGVHSFAPEHGQAGSVADVSYTTGNTVGDIELFTNHRNQRSCCFAIKHKQSYKNVPLWETWLTWIGQHSLEIYLLYGFMLNLLKMIELPNYHTAEGIILMMGNY